MTQIEKIFKICLFLAIFHNLYAGTESNYDCLTRLTDTVLQKPVSLLPDASSVVYMNAAVPQSANNWFLETALINQLKEKFPGIQIRSYSPADSLRLKVHDVLITYQILALGITYKVPTDSKLKNLFWTRTARVNYFLQIQTGAENEIIWNSPVQKQKQDLIPVKNVTQIENKTLDFTRAAVPPRDSWKRFIEPTITILSTGAVIFLFYAYRSR